MHSRKGERGQRAEKFLMFKCYLSCHNTRTSFHMVSVVPVEVIYVSIYFLSPAFLLLNQHRKF